MEYIAKYLVTGLGPKELIFKTNTSEEEVREEAWRKAAAKERVNPEKINLLDCSPTQ